MSVAVNRVLMWSWALVCVIQITGKGGGLLPFHYEGFVVLKVLAGVMVSCVTGCRLFFGYDSCNPRSNVY